MQFSVVNSDRFTGTKRFLPIQKVIFLVVHNFGASPVRVFYNDYPYDIPAADTSKRVSIPQNSFVLDCKGYPFDVENLRVEAGINTVIVNYSTLTPDKC